MTHLRRPTSGPAGPVPSGGSRPPGNPRLSALLLLTALLLPGCGPKRADRIILISIDTCRADHLGCYGFRGGSTPHLDAFARDGILFSREATAVPLTLPAHCSMLTGTTPLAHGVHDNSGYRLADSKTTVAEILRNAGYRTAGVAGATVLDARTNVNQGFETWDDRFGEDPKAKTDPAAAAAPASAALPTAAPAAVPMAAPAAERNATEVTRIGSEWIEKNRKGKFFLFLHYYDPHVTYAPPEPYASSFPGDPYSGEIAYVDAEIGRLFDLLKKLKLYDTSLIIVTADHGEGLGEHGEAAHDYFIYQSTVHVPLLVKPPRYRPRPGNQTAGGMGPAGSVVERPVTITDITPTILQAARLPLPAETQGEDLLGKPAPSETGRSLYCESLTPTRYGCNPLLGILDGRWKYIASTRPELYDLEKDPNELTNLLEQEPGRAELLRGKLGALIFALRPAQAAPAQDGRAAPDKETNERLRSLGYISGSSVRETFSLDPGKPDAKDRLELHAGFGEALRLMAAPAGLDQARAKLTELETRFPDVPDLQSLHASLEYDAGRKDEAVLHYKAALNLMEGAAASSAKGDLAISPDLAKTHYDLANALADLRLTDEAVTHYREALRVDPDYAGARFNLGITLAEAGRIAEAETVFGELIRRDPGHADAHYNLALVYLRTGRGEQASQEIQQTLRLDPKHAGAHLLAGDLAAANRNLPEAAAQYGEALRLQPSFADARYKLARVLVATGKPVEAVAMYKSAVEAMPGQPAVAGELAWILATHENPKIRDGAEAVRLAEAACMATGFSQGQLLGTLAAAYAEAGRFEDAIRTEEKGLAIARASGQPKLVAAVEARIAQYRERRPVRSRF